MVFVYLSSNIKSDIRKSLKNHFFRYYEYDIFKCQKIIQTLVNVKSYSITCCGDVLMLYEECEEFMKKRRGIMVEHSYLLDVKQEEAYVISDAFSLFAQFSRNGLFSF